jgi:hypothetical protein
VKNNVINASTISVWADNLGWQTSNMMVFISADGRKWKQVGHEKVKKDSFQKYDFTVAFGDVKYIKVSRSGGPFSWLRIDAVGAKGGDTGNQCKDDKKKK